MTVSDAQYVLTGGDESVGGGAFTAENVKGLRRSTHLVESTSGKQMRIFFSFGFWKKYFIQCTMQNVSVTGSVF